MAADKALGSAHIDKFHAAVVQRLCLLVIDLGGASNVEITPATVQQLAIFLEGYIDSRALRDTSLAQALHQLIAVRRIVVENVAVIPPASKHLDGNGVVTRGYTQFIELLHSLGDATLATKISKARNQRGVVVRDIGWHCQHPLDDLDRFLVTLLVKKRNRERAQIVSRIQGIEPHRPAH